MRSTNVVRNSRGRRQPYPPAIPMVMPGENVGHDHELALLFAYGAAVRPALHGIRQGSRGYQGEGGHLFRVPREAVAAKAARCRRLTIVCAVITALTRCPLGRRSSIRPRPRRRQPFTGFERTFNVDATWGSFGFLNSLTPIRSRTSRREISERAVRGRTSPSASSRRSPIRGKVVQQVYDRTKNFV